MLRFPRAKFRYVVLPPERDLQVRLQVTETVSSTVTILRTGVRFSDLKRHEGMYRTRSSARNEGGTTHAFTLLVIIRSTQGQNVNS